MGTPLTPLSTMLPSSHPTTTSLLLLLVLLLLHPISSLSSPELASSDLRTLLRLRRLLSYPTQLSLLDSSSPSSLCSLPPSPSLTLSCTASGRLSSLLLHSPSSLSSSPSLSSLLPTLSHLRSLSHLSLSSLSLRGPLPATLSHLPSSLRSLDLSSNLLSGPLPTSLLKLRHLRSLDLSSNLLNDSLPDLSNFTALTRLDLSRNHLSGAIPPSLLSLPSISTLNLSSNAFSGEVPPASACGGRLAVVDVSTNRLVGRLPACISSNTSRAVTVVDDWNCLASPPANGSFQHPPSYCAKRPLAAIPAKAAASAAAAVGRNAKLGLVLGVIGAAVAAAGVFVLAAVGVWRVRKRRWRSRCGEGSPVKESWEAKRRSRNVRIGVAALGATPYRVFEEEDVEEMTGEFDDSNLVKDRSSGVEFYKGWLWDGTAVFVRRLELKQRLSTASLRQFTDVISKLQHHHLVNVLGHAIVVGNNANDTMVYLVFERFSNGTLRSHLTGWRKRETMKWPQRVAATVGVARGIQFLHTCGIYSNNIKMENVLMDEALTPKITNYALPIPNGSKSNKVTGRVASNRLGGKHDLSDQNVDIKSKEDIFQLGVILIEIITGKSTSNEEELKGLELQLWKILTESIMELHKFVDPGIHGTYMYESLRTMTEITLSCLSRDPTHRPSIDDVLWHLQYSIQVQYACASSGSLSVQSFSVTT